MANKVLLKKSSVAAKVPLTTDLDYGELALNYADGKLHYKKSDGVTIDNFSSAAVIAAGYVAKTGDTMTGNLTISSTYPRINLTDTDNDSDYSIINSDGAFAIYDVTNAANRLVVTSTGNLGLGVTSPAARLDALSIGNTTAGSKAFQLIGGTNTGDAGGMQYGLYVSQAGARYSDQTAIYAVAGTGATGTTGTFASQYYGVQGRVSITSTASQKGTGLYGVVDVPNWNYNRLNAGVQGLATGGSTAWTAQYGLDGVTGAFGGHFVSHGKATSVGVYADAYLDASPGTGAVAVPLLVASNGVERMRVDAAGNVLVTGAGATTLEVKSLINTSAALKLSSTGGIQAGMFMANPTVDHSLGFQTAGTERMRLDSSGNLGLGVTPSAWDGNFLSLTVRNVSVSDLGLSTNMYYNAGYKRIGSGSAALYGQVNGSHNWSIAASGAAGSAISFTQAMTLDASGNLGIGTTTPTKRFDIVGTYRAQIDPSNGVAGYYGATLTLGGDNGTNQSGVRVSAAYEGSAFGLSLQTSTTAQAGLTSDPSALSYTTCLRIDSTGNVGIGTISPSSRLHVEGGAVTTNIIATSGNGLVRLANSVAGANRKELTVILDTTNNRIDFQAVQQGVAFMPITLNAGGGNIGVGTTSPSSKLDVAGDIRVNSINVFNGSTGTTTATTQTAVASFATATYGSGKFVIQATQGTLRHIIELLVVHDGTTAYATEYGMIRTGASLFTTDVDISAGNVRVLVTSTSATSTVYKISQNLMLA